MNCKLRHETFASDSLASGATHTTWPGKVVHWPGALAAIQELHHTIQGSSSSTAHAAVSVLRLEDNMGEVMLGTSDVDVNMTARYVLGAVYIFAKGLPRFAAIAQVGLTCAALANSASIRGQVSTAAAAAAAAGKQQAHQAAAAAMAAMSPASEAAAAHQPSKASLAAGTEISLAGVGAKRPAEAEATRAGEKRLKAAIASAQEQSSMTLVDYALRGQQGREYVTVEVKQPAYLTTSHTEPMPDLVEVYNSCGSAGGPLVAHLHGYMNRCDLGS